MIYTIFDTPYIVFKEYINDTVHYYEYFTPEVIPYIEEDRWIDPGILQPYVWFDDDTLLPVSAPIFNIPESASEHSVTPEFLRLFNIYDGYNEVNVEVPSAKLTNITITKSGVYSKTPSSLEYGKLYTFKADLTDIDFEELATYGQEVGDNQYMLYTNGNSAIGLSLENEEYRLLFMTESTFFSYTKSNGWLVEENVFGDVNKPVWRPYGSIEFGPIMEESLEATSNTGWEYLLPLFE
jgi:hypothetical protein